MRDREEARAHGVERRSGSEKSEGAAAECGWGRREAPKPLLPSPAAPRPPAASRRQPRPSALRIRPAGRARRAQNVAADTAPAPCVLALGAGVADPGRRRAVPRRPAAHAPRTAGSQEQVSAPSLSRIPEPSPRPPASSSPTRSPVRSCSAEGEEQQPEGPLRLPGWRLLPGGPCAPPTARWISPALPAVLPPGPRGAGSVPKSRATRNY